MLGSMPSFVPQYQAMPVQSYPAPAYVQQPAAPNFARPASPQAAPPSSAPLPPPPPSTVRAQADDRANPRLQIPSPQQLGLIPAQPAPAPTAAIDWARVHLRLEQLGATCFQVTKVTDGSRVTCLLPTAQPDRSHRIEAEAGSEAEAVRLALQKVDEWALSARR
jgi:hypothetical protein